MESRKLRPFPSSQHPAPSLPTTHTAPVEPHSATIYTPKLGDFSTLDLTSIPSKPNHYFASCVVTPTPSHSKRSDSIDTTPDSNTSTHDGLALGNFSRIFNLLGRPQIPKASTASSYSAKMKFDMLLTNEDQPAMGIHIKTAKAVDTENTAFRIDEQLGGLKLGQSDLSEAESDPVSDNDSIVSHSTSATSLSSSPSRSDLEHRPEAPGLYYESQPNGPTYPVPKEDLAPVFDCNAADKLIAASQQDRIVQQSCPTVHKNGVHVFLDLSNIHIGFLNTLKDKVGLPPAIRFWPNPVFNLEDLTAIITRGRTVRTLRAGCSILPGRSKPAFISELRRLKYQVDIRERKPTHEPKNSRSFQEASSPKTTRYVEDMVDETLQNRIAEAFMEEPEKKGTLVIVTGDAQPAKYSDGFYKYATRALKWGWHIEVVCWRISCSSLWRDLAADESLRHRFRLIELDPYVGYLADGS